MVLQTCDAGSLPESLTSQIIRQAQCFHVTKLSLRFAQVHSVQTTSQSPKTSQRGARTGLHNCITFRNKTLANSNKLIHIVTLRQHSS